MHVHLTPLKLAYAHSEGDTSVVSQLAACPECRQAAQTLVQCMVVADHPDPLVGEGVVQGRLLLEKLLTLPFGRAREILKADEECHHWGLARLLLLSSQHVASFEGDLDRASDLAVLALDVIARLDPDIYGAHHCLRITVQGLEAGFRILALSAGRTAFARFLEAAFLHVYLLLENILTRAPAEPAEPPES